MTNREWLNSLTDKEYVDMSITHHTSTEPMYYMTSDDTMFEFTHETDIEAWEEAVAYELYWLKSEKNIPNNKLYDILNEIMSKPLSQYNKDNLYGIKEQAERLESTCDDLLEMLYNERNPT